MMRMRAGGLLALASAGMGLAIVAAALAANDPQRPENLQPRAFLPQLAAAEKASPTPPPPTVTPTPRPVTADGMVTSLYLGSARMYGGQPFETRNTHIVNGRELFEDPSAPPNIVMYPQWGTGRPGRLGPGEGGMNTVFAAHVNYVNYGNGPFAYLHLAQEGDALYVTLSTGDVLTFTVKSVAIVPLSDLDMDGVVFPALDSYTERVTLISCGGTFVPAAVGGEYTSRVVLVAERYVP